MATLGHLRISKLPRVILARLELLASPRFTARGNPLRLNGIRLARLRKVKSRRRTFRVRRKSATLLRILRRAIVKGQGNYSLAGG